MTPTRSPRRRSPYGSYTREASVSKGRVRPIEGGTLSRREDCGTSRNSRRTKEGPTGAYFFLGYNGEDFVGIRGQNRTYGRRDCRGSSNGSPSTERNFSRIQRMSRRGSKATLIGLNAYNDRNQGSGGYYRRDDRDVGGYCPYDEYESVFTIQGVESMSRYAITYGERKRGYLSGYRSPNKELYRGFQLRTRSVTMSNDDSQLGNGVSTGSRGRCGRSERRRFVNLFSTTSGTMRRSGRTSRGDDRLPRVVSPNENRTSRFNTGKLGVYQYRNESYGNSRRVSRSPSRGGHVASDRNRYASRQCPTGYFARPSSTFNFANRTRNIGKPKAYPTTGTRLASRPNGTSRYRGGGVQSRRQSPTVRKGSN